MTLYGLGFVPDKPRVRDRVGSARRRLAHRVGSGRLPDEAGFPDDSPLIRSQGHRNACTWFAGVQGARHRAMALGLDLPDLSPWFGYWWTRRDLVLLDEHVEDNGASPRQMVRTAKVRGCCRLKDFPIAKIDGPPPGVANIRAQRLILDLRPIYSSGRELIERICACLVHQKPVLIGLPVTKAMMANDGPTMLGPVREQDVLGLHMTELYRYRTTSGGRRILRQAGSWGVDWRDRGRAELEPEYVQQAHSVLYVESVRRRR